MTSYAVHNLNPVNYGKNTTELCSILSNGSSFYTSSLHMDHENLQCAILILSNVHTATSVNNAYLTQESCSILWMKEHYKSNLAAFKGQLHVLQSYCNHSNSSLLRSKYSTNGMMNLSTMLHYTLNRLSSIWETLEPQQPILQSKLIGKDVPLHRCQTNHACMHKITTKSENWEFNEIMETSKNIVIVGWDKKKF